MREIDGIGGIGITGQGPRAAGDRRPRARAAPLPPGAGEPGEAPPEIAEALAAEALAGTIVPAVHPLRAGRTVTAAQIGRGIADDGPRAMRAQARLGTRTVQRLLGGYLW